jgi:two-component system, cell cycle response regulator
LQRPLPTQQIEGKRSMNKEEKNALQKLTEKLESITIGEIHNIDLEPSTIAEFKRLEEAIVRQGKMLSDANNFISALCRGNLDVEPPPRNPLIGHFKQMHANLRHLTWQTKQIAAGDLDQHVDFLGSFSVAFNQMIEALREKRKTDEKVRYLSLHDPLTDLYNYAYFKEEVGRLEKSRCFPVSVMVADLDGLKKINDSLGHLTGDELIKAAANILRQTVRTGDIITRLGGDEFALIFPNTDNQTAITIAERIRKVESEFNQKSTLFQVSLSIGMATAALGESISRALILADELMYKNKSIRKDRMNQKEGV